jgi:hypothetical protein
MHFPRDRGTAEEDHVFAMSTNRQQRVEHKLDRWQRAKVR